MNSPRDLGRGTLNLSFRIETLVALLTEIVSMLGSFISNGDKVAIDIDAN